VKQVVKGAVAGAAKGAVSGAAEAGSKATGLGQTTQEETTATKTKSK
jgi:hypothetical protein